MRRCDLAGACGERPRGTASCTPDPGDARRRATHPALLKLLPPLLLPPPPLPPPLPLLLVVLLLAYLCHRGCRHGETNFSWQIFLPVGVALTCPNGPAVRHLPRLHLLPPVPCCTEPCCTVPCCAAPCCATLAQEKLALTPQQEQTLEAHQALFEQRAAALEESKAAVLAALFLLFQVILSRRFPAIAMLSMVLSAVMMLEHIGEMEIAGRISKAVAEVISEGKVKTYDMMKLSGNPDVFSKGAATTQQMGDAIISKL